MNAEKPAGKNRQLGKKIVYGLVIALSVLVIVLNAGLIIGVWAVEQPVSELAVTALEFVEDSARIAQSYTARVDEVLENLQARTTVVAVAAEGLREAVVDQGLILSLLPEERESQLSESADALRGTFSEIGESVSRVVALYRAINRLPFVDLPTLDEDPVDELGVTVDATQSGAEVLRDRISEYRSGGAGKIEKVEEAATALGEQIQRARDRVELVDNRMAALEAGAIALQSKVVAILTMTAIILTLFLAFVIWTQVEMIRQYSARWGRLGQEQGPARIAAQALPAASGSVQASEMRPKSSSTKGKSVKKQAAVKKKRTGPAKKK